MTAWLAAAGGRAERSQQLQKLNLLQTYKALTNGGVPPHEAQAAIGNPARKSLDLRSLKRPACRKPACPKS